MGIHANDSLFRWYGKFLIFENTVIILEGTILIQIYIIIIIEIH